MTRQLVRPLVVTALAAGLVLGGAGLAIAGPAPSTNDDVTIKLPVDQQLINAYNTATGYEIKTNLLPDTAQPKNRVQDVGAQGAALNSPGVVSGNTLQVPVHVPVNACGNTISVVGLLNPTFGNNCVNK